MGWQQQPMQSYEEFGNQFGSSGAMHASKVSSEPSHIDMYPPGYFGSCYANAESQETGSDASTADTTPYLTDEPFYADVPDMSWPGAYPQTTAVPFPNFAATHRPEPQQQPWEQTGWADLQQVPEAALPALPTVGSAKHHLGQCKPCAFAWKPEGCQSGPECKFCHLCPPCEKQRRKKVLRQLQRNIGVYK